MPLATARRVLEIEAQAIRDLLPRLGAEFTAAVDILFACTGRVVVTGMGKSGLIGQKISATLSSTGTPSLYLHPADAIHGDLGRIVKGDVVLAISYSGETEVIVALTPTVRRLGSPLLAITGAPGSTLATDRRRPPRRLHPRGGLPARPGPHRVHDRRPRAGRRAGHDAAGAPRLHRRRLRGAAPGRAAGTQAPPRGGRHAHRQRGAARHPGDLDEGRALRDDAQAAGHDHGHGRGRKAGGDDLRRRPAAADGAPRVHAARPHRGAVHDHGARW